MISAGRRRQDDFGAPDMLLRRELRSPTTAPELMAILRRDVATIPALMTKV
jgi:hypothetical protein